jgi:hypothetical protein
MIKEHTSHSNGHNPTSTAQVAIERIQEQPAPGVDGAARAQQSLEMRAKDYQSLRGITAEIHQGMFDHGYNRAIDGGVLEVRHEDTKAIEQHAQQAARECDRDLFDEQLHAHDRMHKAEHEKHLADRHHAEGAEAFAYVEKRERAIEAARVQAGEAPNKRVWIVLGVVAAIALSISFVLTFHDVFFLFSDEVLSWLVSFTAASVIGVVIAVMILVDTETAGHRSITHMIALSGGLLIAVGFAAARLRDATTTGEYIFTLALMLFEIGIIVGLEGIAMRLRAAHEAYATKLAIESQANSLLAEASAHHQHCQLRRQELDLDVKGDINYVEGRNHRYFRIDDLVEVMVAAALDGYNAGIAFNRGLILGAKRRSA